MTDALYEAHQEIAAHKAQIVELRAQNALLIAEREHWCEPLRAREAKLREALDLSLDAIQARMAELAPDDGRATLWVLIALNNMLEALQYIVAWNSGEWSAGKAQVLARAAIAKAEGKP